MFDFKIFDECGFEIGTSHVKESFLLYLSPSNQLVDATLIRNTKLKETLKDYGDFAWLEDTQVKEDDDYSFALDINKFPYDTISIY